MKTIEEIIETGSYEEIMLTQIGHTNPAGICNKGFNMTVVSDIEYAEPLYFKNIKEAAVFLEKLGGHNFKVYDYKYF